MNKKLLLELLTRYIQVLHVDVDVQIVLLAPISRHIISPWHDSKTEDRFPFGNCSDWV